MTGAPETIWAVHWNTEGAVVNGAWADTIRHFCGGIEYRRADLVAPATLPMPLTTSQIMADERVRALVEAAFYIVDGMGIDGPDYKMDTEDDYQDAANSTWVCDTLTRLCAALARLKEPT